MSKYKFIYLIWLLPAYLLFLTVHQVLVYQGIGDTYNNGESYTAQVVDFDIKKIASQTNGYVVLNFETDNGENIERRLSLPIELASMITDFSQIPIRYQKGTFEEIVMMPTYSEHRNMVLSNAAISLIGLFIALGVAVIGHRYATRKQNEVEEELVFERVD
ncbi:hypothetical protein NC796_13535 [Aliifodinibius sp. S!AR15-10]|uniref:hypothetical protein n=1 Tax=Aliifodinibius sp. S!AR15-10 TaxID=2950437 RepID=UPI0028672094|nr:hypothetical protein [Aliifodinibius sp. S!AR15-10]MDR8392171.1 hypothetical protein [Aliifodinibius sp. S!AR15-10]